MSVTLLPPTQTISLKAFRAVDQPELCEKFIEGHQAILSNLGVDPSSGNNHTWMSDPNTLMVVVQQGDRVLGGARIQCSSEENDLPIQSAIRHLDPSVDTLVNAKPLGKVGEVCGLWASRRLAVMGVSMIYFSRVCIAVAQNAGIESLLALCAQVTVKHANEVGYRPIKRLGDEGTFAYPVPEMTATAMELNDIEDLSYATEENRTEIFKLANLKFAPESCAITVRRTTILHDLNI